MASSCCASAKHGAEDGEGVGVCDWVGLIRVYVFLYDIVTAIEMLK